MSSISGLSFPYQTNSVFTADPVIASVEANENWKAEPPLLTHPDHLPAIDYRFLTVSEETRKLGNEILDTLSLRISGIKEKIQEISVENLKKLRDVAEKAKNSDFWSVLKKIATCLLSAISIVFGVALLGAGGSALVGGAMLASGILSLANFALSELNIWDWIADYIAHDNEDLKNNLKMILPMSFGILAGGIGLVGSVNAIATGAVQFIESALFVAQSAVSIFDGLTTIGKGSSDAQLIWEKADLLKIQAGRDIEQEHFTSIIDIIKGSMEDFKTMKAKTRKTLQMIENTNIQLARQV